MKNIIKTDDYLLLVSDEDIKDENIENVWNEIKNGVINTYKIIAHLPLNNSPILEGVDLLPPLEDEVKKLGEKCWCDNEITNIHSFVIGYNKAKEKYKYTEEDMIEYSNWLFKWCEYNKYRKLIYGVEPYGIGEFISDKDMFVKFLKEKSHQQPKYPIGFECEMVTRVLDVYPQTINHIPKTTTNSQGQTVLEGKYIYE